MILQLDRRYSHMHKGYEAELVSLVDATYVVILCSHSTLPFPTEMHPRQVVLVALAKMLLYQSLGSSLLLCSDLYYNGLMYS